MNREQDRIRRKMESNPVVECNKVRQKFCPELFQDFSGTKEPRHIREAGSSMTDVWNGIFIRIQRKQQQRINLFKIEPSLPYSVYFNHILGNNSGSYPHHISTPFPDIKKYEL